MSRGQYHVERTIYVVVLVALILIFVSPFAIPIVLAGSIALALFPYQLKLIKRGWKIKRAAALLTTFFTVVISIPFLFFVAKGSMLVVTQLERLTSNDRGVAGAVKSLRLQMMEKTMGVLEKYPPFGQFLSEEKLQAYFKSVTLYLLKFFQNFAYNIPMVTLFLVVMIFCTYSFLKNAEPVRNFFQEIFGFSNRKMDQLVGIFLRDARQVYLSNIVTGLVQASLVATGVYLVTHTDWFLVFFITLILSFVPVIGAAPVAFVFAIIAFFQDHNGGAIALVVLGTVTGLVDNLLRPWLATFGETKAPAIAIFVCVIGGAILLGFSGLFIGLLVGSLAYDTLPLFWNEIGKSDARKGISGLFSLREKPESETEKPLN